MAYDIVLRIQVTSNNGICIAGTRLTDDVGFGRDAQWAVSNLLLYLCLALEERRNDATIRDWLDGEISPCVASALP